MMHSDGDWIPVRTGESGDAVYRRRDGAAFAKIASRGREAELKGERDRLLWLADRGIACPRVLDWRETEARLVISGVSGVSASELSSEHLAAAWPSIVAMVGSLHRLDFHDCPFDRRVSGMLARARDVVGRGAVNPDFLSEADRPVPPPMLLAWLERELSRRVEEEAGEQVVCHGDATMPNLMVDPVTLRCTGLIDLGRAGVADPYADFALMLASGGETWASDTQARTAYDQLFQGLGIAHPDPERLAFYLRLDPLTWG